MQDIRWKQQFNNYIKAFQTLAETVEFVQKCGLTKLEQLGMIHSFEFTHDLAWNVLKDYLQDKGVTDLAGPKDVIRSALKNGLIDSGEDWMAMIKARDLTLHTYNPEIAQAVSDDIQEHFYPAFKRMAKKFTRLSRQQNSAL